MSKLPNLQSIRDTIRGNIMAEKLAKQSAGDATPLHNGMAVVPESSMVSLIYWLHEVILPKIEQTRGVDSVEYINHVGVRDAVIWSLYIAGKYESLLLQVQRDRQLLGYYIDKNAFLENQLQKYTTVEQLISDETAKDLRAAIVSRAIDLLNQKPKSDEEKKVQP